MDSVMHFTSNIFSSINRISISAKNCNCNFIFFKTAYRASLDGERKRTKSNSHSSRNIF